MEAVAVQPAAVKSGVEIELRSGTAARGTGVTAVVGAPLVAADPFALDHNTMPPLQSACAVRTVGDPSKE